MALGCAEVALVWYPATHAVRRLLLHGSGNAGIGVQGEPGAVVAQHGGEVFTSTPFCRASTENVCPYGIIRTHRKPLWCNGLPDLSLFFFH